MSSETLSSTTDVKNLVHPYTNLGDHLNKGPMIIDRGEGIYIYDNHGKRYLEGMSGLWCTSLGFSEERLVNAAIAQFKKLPYYHLFNSRSNTPAIELSAKLLEIAPKNLSKILYANSGSEANDAAVKLVWFYHNAIGKPEKKKIISRLRGYHGVTVASGSLTGLPANHLHFDLPIDRILHTDCPSYYHGAESGESEEAFTQRLINNLEQLILKEGPETVGAFIAEPVMGAGGVIVPPEGYFEGVQKVLKKYDILFIVDEVICGFGRTGMMFGCDTFNLQPDIMSVAKALSSSYLPISATMISQAIYDKIAEQSDEVGVFAHGVTYSGHPICAAVALETIKIYQEDNIVAHVQEVAPHFQKRLHALASHPLVGESRGIGLIGAIELTQDKASKKPFDSSVKIEKRVQENVAKHGVLVRGIRNAIALCPPLIITIEQIDELFDSLEKGLDEVLEDIEKSAVSV
ncbi:aspartate aminotransferase family protein [Advenella sp. WQ 585]|uniref:Aspartate aminotransferase family protein n=1 Tax=Advenella mandrilli TaxID=2800330 RepID=A0ABS1ED69_9BURK|nr:aspartate aminotransferase family protein [Advenella mandrilli]MBK1780210.1 aspartate aminotransferase family protein [Advenella mandrilli]